MEDGGHLLGDGHLDAIAAGETQSCGCGEDAFRHFTVEAGDDVLQLAAFAQFDANRTIARESTGAGENQVPDAGEARHGLATATAGHGKSRDLGDAASDQRGGRVVAEFKTGDDPGGEGDDILERARRVLCR